MNKIAQTLNERGYRTYNGSRFTKTIFWDWHANKKYIGMYTWDVRQAKNPDGTRNNHRKRTESEQVQVMGVVPAIIDEAVWKEVNEILAARKRNPNIGKRKTNYLLADKVFCGKCGSEMRGSTYSSRARGKVYSYYRCSGKCGNKHISREDLERSALQEIIELCFDKEAERDIVERVRGLYVKKAARS